MTQLNKTIAVVSVLAASFFTAFVSANEVEVLKASSSVTSRLNQAAQNFDVMVVVKNLGSDKKSDLTSTAP